MAGKGVFVPGSHIERDLEVLKGFTQTMPDRNVMPSVKVLKKMIRSAGAKYAMMFGFHPKDEMFYIERMCYGNGEPVSMEEIFVPRNLVPKILSGVLNYPRLARQVMSGQWPDLLPQELRALHGAAGLPSGMRM